MNRSFGGFVMATTAYKSLHFGARTVWSGKRRASLSAAGRPDIAVGSPPQFNGDPDVWAPDELLVGSLNTCTPLTFLTLARGHGVTLVAYESDAEGRFENVDGTFRMTQVTVRPRIAVKSEAEIEPARNAMDSVEAHCFIAKSITAKVVLEPKFVVGA
jgi:organic hydroperoxide reductase OsmC/OhrA